MEERTEGSSGQQTADSSRSSQIIDGQISTGDSTGGRGQSSLAPNRAKRAHGGYL
jgi:hypothetical protein